jgi:predicted DNA binding protein
MGVDVKYYTKGVKEDLVCEISLSSENKVNTINVNSDKFLFKIVLKDIVDLEDFLNLLKKKEKKVDLYCNLVKDEKNYKGPRKVVRKKDKVAVSQGGIRLEFEQESQNRIIDILNVAKAY